MLEISTEITQSARRIVRLTVEWFLRITLSKKSAEENLVQLKWYDEIKRIPLTNAQSAMFIVPEHEHGSYFMLCFI